MDKSHAEQYCIQKHLKDDVATQEVGALIAQHSNAPLIIHLNGDLGSGKTTFARGYIQALGQIKNVQVGNVKSPTFSLLETYNFENLHIYHLDLYRLKDPEELEYIGIRDLSADEKAICLIEWPQRGGGHVPDADLELSLAHEGDERQVDIRHKSDLGLAIMRHL